MAIDFVAIAYATIVTAGGLIGFAKKGSIVSGLMGLVAGGLMAVGAYQTSSNPKNYYLSLVVSGGLFGLMGYR